MKRLFEDLLLQLLADQLVEQAQHLIEWLSAAPWQVWFA